MESLPDETLINIYYQLPPEEAKNLCLTNPNLARFCREKSVRLSALRNYYRKVSNVDIVFVTLITGLAAEQRDLERIEALLDLHPEWIDATFALTSPSGQDNLYARPLELASGHPDGHPEIILLLLSRQANPLATALLDWSAFAHPVEESWIVKGLSEQAPSDLGYSILKASSMYGNPMLHLICLYKDYSLSWDEMDFSEMHLDILMTYANRDPLPNPSIFTRFVPSRIYFPLLSLLQRMTDDTIIKRSFLATLCEVTIAAYRRVQFPRKSLKFDFSLLTDESSIPFYQLRQFDFWLGPLNPSVWGEDGMMARLAVISQLKVALPPEGSSSTIEPFTVSLNYYSGLGLVIGLHLLDVGYSVEKVDVMETIQRTLEEGSPVACLDAEFGYRLNPLVAILPHLLTLKFKEGGMYNIQYEDPDFASGLKLAVHLSGQNPEEIVQIIR